MSEKTLLLLTNDWTCQGNLKKKNICRQKLHEIANNFPSIEERLSGATLLLDIIQQFAMALKRNAQSMK